MPKITTGISLEDHVVREAKAEAVKQRRTFSNYVEGLIIADLDLDGGIKVAPVINSVRHKNKVARLKRRKPA